MYHVSAQGVDERMINVHYYYYYYYYFPVNRRRTRSQIWNLEPPSMPTLSACNIIRIYSKVEDYESENKTHVDTEYE